MILYDASVLAIVQDSPEIARSPMIWRDVPFERPAALAADESLMWPVLSSHAPVHIDVKISCLSSRGGDWSASHRCLNLLRQWRPIERYTSRNWRVS